MDKYEEQKDNLIEIYEEQKDNIVERYEQQKDNIRDKYERQKDNLVEKYEKPLVFLVGNIPLTVLLNISSGLLGYLGPKSRGLEILFLSTRCLYLA